jgi:hypothetical protein
MLKSMVCLLVVLLGTRVNGSAQNPNTKPHSPTIVFKKGLRGQTSPVKVSFTPSVEADFRISVYLTTDAEADGSCGSVTANWTDEYFGGANRAKSSNSGGPQYDLSAVLHSAANSVITLSTSNCNGNVYDIFVTVERL